MAMNGDAPRDEAVHIILHEYTHFYLATQFSGEYPPWFNEGLAELMGFAMFTDEGKAVMQIPMYQVHEARDGDWIPFDRLIKVEHARSGVSVAQARRQLLRASLADGALRHDREPRVRRSRSRTTSTSSTRCIRSEEAARTAFGETLPPSIKQLRDYSRSTT